MSWRIVGSNSFCETHKATFAKGDVCNDCIIEKSSFSDADAVRISSILFDSDVHESKLVVLSDKLESIADDFLEGRRPTLQDKTEPASLAQKFYDLAIKARRSALQITMKRVEREHLRELQKAVLDIRTGGSH
jgi:hypothetical protein